MFINDKLIYIELEKTGCTHIIELLKEFLGGIIISKHNRLIGHDNARTVVGSIRNPWDWYLSLWAYGCTRRGREYAMLCTWQWDKILKGRQPMLMPRKKWKRLYHDYRDVEAFREWISLLLNSSAKNDIQEGYAKHPLAHSIGLMTYRFLRMYLPHTSKALPPDRNAFLEFVNKHMHVEYVLQLETLEEDFMSLTTTVLNKEWSPAEKQELYRRRSTPVNASQKLSKDLYFDKETIELIAKNEWVIIQKFNYEYEPI